MEVIYWRTTIALIWDSFFTSLYQFINSNFHENGIAAQEEHIYLRFITGSKAEVFIIKITAANVFFH